MTYTVSSGTLNPTQLNSYMLVEFEFNNPPMNKIAFQSKADHPVYVFNSVVIKDLIVKAKVKAKAGL